MSKNLEPRKSSVFRVFSDSYAYEHYERFMHVNILVVFLDVDMLQSKYIIDYLGLTPTPINLHNASYLTN